MEKLNPIDLLDANIDAWRKIAGNIRIPSNSLRHFYAFTLAGKILGLVKASKVLFSEHYNRESKILCRSLIECAFRLCALSKDTGNLAAEFLAANDLENLDRIQKFPPDPRMPIVIDAYQKRVNNWKNKGINFRKFSIFDIAQKAGLEDMYRTHYFYYSWNTHTDINELQDFLNLSEKNQIVGVDLEPQQNGCAKEIARFCMLNAMALDGFCKIFNIASEHPEQLIKLADNLAEQAIQDS